MRARKHKTQEATKHPEINNRKAEGAERRAKHQANNEGSEDAAAAADDEDQQVTQECGSATHGSRIAEALKSMHSHSTLDAVAKRRQQPWAEGLRDFGKTMLTQFRTDR